MPILPTLFLAVSLKMNRNNEISYLENLISQILTPHGAHIRMETAYERSQKTPFTLSPTQEVESPAMI